MKTPTATLQTLIDTDAGSQPTYIVKIDWPTPKYYTMYADTIDVTLQEQLKELDSVSLQVNADSSANVDTVQLTLVDTDGVLLTDFKTHGVKGRTAAVYLSYMSEDSDDFLALLDGKVTGDVTWDTDNNTLSLEITTRVDEALVGYSTKTLADMHPDAEDAAWPMIFGAPLRVPALHIKRRPVAFLASGISQNFLSFSVSDSEGFTLDTSITIEVGGIRMTGSLDTDNLFTTTSINDAIHTSISIAGRETSDPSYGDPSVIWLLDESINIKDQYCYVNELGGLANFCIEQVGRKCTFARVWGLEYISNTASDTILLSYIHSIAETAAVPRTSWGSGSAGPQLKWLAPDQTLLRLSDNRSMLIRDSTGFYAISDWFVIAGGEPVYQVVAYDDLYISNLVSSYELLEVWGEVSDNDIDMRPVPSNYYTLDLGDIVDGKTCTTLTMSTP